jgi:hypothetical protein
MKALKMEEACVVAGGMEMCTFEGGMVGVGLVDFGGPWLGFIGGAAVEQSCLAMQASPELTAAYNNAYISGAAL